MVGQLGRWVSLAVEDHPENHVLGDLSEVFPVANDQGGSGISGGAGGKGFECQVPQRVGTVTLLGSDAGKELCRFTPVLFAWV